MATTTSSAALLSITPVFTGTERLALAGFLPGYSGLTREAYELDLRQFTSWCQQHQLVGPHTLRQAFITAALDAGVPLRDVQEAASHVDLAPRCATTRPDPRWTGTQPTSSPPMSPGPPDRTPLSHNRPARPTVTGQADCPEGARLGPRSLVTMRPALNAREPPFWRILGPQLRSWKAAQKGGSGSRWSVRPIAQAGDLAGDALLLPDCLDVVDVRELRVMGRVLVAALR